MASVAASDDSRHHSPPQLATPSTRALRALAPASPTTRLGSLSPGSIPSSPNSIHSSSSAIFERDIEPLPTARGPRGGVDAAVPSVLTSAAAALADDSAPPGVAIVAPAQILPTSALPSPVGPPSPTLAPAPELPELDDARARNRLSFVSYNDLLLSAPVGTVPLAAITQPASTAPPPHLPAVSAPPTGRPGSRPRSVRASMLLDKDLGGEWEREGLGLGLEERLEALLRADPGPPRALAGVVESA